PSSDWPTVNGSRHTCAMSPSRHRFASPSATNCLPGDPLVGLTHRLRRARSTTSTVLSFTDRGTGSHAWPPTYTGTPARRRHDRWLKSGIAHAADGGS